MNADFPQGSSMKPEPSPMPPAGPEHAEDEATSVLPASETEDTTVLDTSPEDDTRVFEAKPNNDAFVSGDDGDETEVIATREGDPSSSLKSSESMGEPSETTGEPSETTGEPSETTGEPSESESEGSPMPGESKRPAFSPAATGEVPPHALQYDVAQQAHTSAAQSAPRESAFVPQSMSEPTGHTARPGIKFGLLTWGLLLIIAGIAIWMLPWMEHIDWSLAAVIVFGLLGVILLIVAALASFSNHRRKNRG